MGSVSHEVVPMERNALLRLLPAEFPVRQARTVRSFPRLHPHDRMDGAKAWEA
jgi:hypothetical protein